MTDQLAAEQHGRDVASGDPADAAPAHGSTAAAPTRRRFGRAPREQRISKWDRPPEPHDWRYYVGTVGKILIATGLLMFGFVAYQLWGTGIETAMAQHRLEDRFDALLAESADADTPSPPATEAPSAVTTPPADTAPSIVTTPPIDTPNVATGDIATAVPDASDLPDDPVEQDPIPQPSRGEPLLRLEIPAIGRDDIVVPGVTQDDLQNGPGHYPDTPLPGQLGNAAIAGHRTTYGAPFFDVDQLEPGDEIITTLLNGDRFVYEVTSTEIVSASDYWVVTTRDPNIAELTLTSCHPKYTARNRIVVHSVLNPEKSSNVGLPTFYTLDGDADPTPIDGDDPVLSTDAEIAESDSTVGELAESTTGSTADATLDESTTESTAEATADATLDESTTGSTAEATADATLDEEADVVAGADTGDDQPRPVSDEELAEAQAATAGVDPVDAFSRGWFDDRGAVLQIALWGLALTMISLGARRVSKRYRRDSIGILVGVAPFLFALYFFYQNVNRLLPPGI